MRPHCQAICETPGCWIDSEEQPQTETAPAPAVAIEPVREKPKLPPPFPENIGWRVGDGNYCNSLGDLLCLTTLELGMSLGFLPWPECNCTGEAYKPERKFDVEEFGILGVSLMIFSTGILVGCVGREPSPPRPATQATKELLLDVKETFGELEKTAEKLRAKAEALSEAANNLYKDANDAEEAAEE